MDFKAIFQSIPAAATATALSLALAPIAGSAPAVINRGDYYDLVFNPDQEERVSAWILTQLNSEPGPVRVNAGGIAIKVITRKYWPYALGAVALGGVLGYAMRGGKRRRK